MNVYKTNYWSLYMDFIKDFESLKYRGFSLSHIIHFRGLIRKNKAIWLDMKNESFAKRLVNKGMDSEAVQQHFNHYINTHRKPSNTKPGGKVAIHYDTILRFPEHTYKDHFSAQNAMIVAAGNYNKKKTSKSLYKLPTRYLNDYVINIGSSVIEVQNQAKLLLAKYNSHHLYSSKQFQSLLLIKIAEVIHCIEQVQKFFEQEKISCVIVSTTHSYVSRIIALSGYERGIPTICMQHGIIGSEFGYIPKIATVDAVYGNYEVDWYRKRGAIKGSAQVIGHPRFDQAIVPISQTRKEVLKKLGVNPKRKTIMIIYRYH
ncbi:hypothetical protein F9U64_11050 [Gracilibacillus oryzae]|uniref:Uncharacterized protein n=1 Tax=Gracilibacillus oryzae TaxID=1672701 RepID=A0A7C8KYE5_9BACI|nr:hypothetical protein [Gracilibacillus oryzae]KAB8135797.1 hypothetical protein F9U64_11050 [Gracilibacillus oryzae]